MCHFHYTTYCYTLPYQNAHKNKEKKPCKHDAARFSKTVLVPILSNQRVPRGILAPQAAGRIHSDLERGFIRAEVVPLDTLIAAGSMAACREKGLVQIEGKDYPIRDGDVIFFRFNV